MPSFIIFDISKYDDKGFYTTGTSITKAMDKNDSFPTPPVPIADVKTDLELFQSYLVDKINITTSERKERDKLKLKIAEDLKLNGMYVVITFPKDEPRQLSTNYPPAKKGERLTGPPEKPSDVRVRQGKLSGEVVLNCKKKRGTISINVRISDKSPNPDPRIINSSSSVGIFVSGLTPGMQYFFEVQALGAKGNSDWSSPADMYVA